MIINNMMKSDKIKMEYSARFSSDALYPKAFIDISLRLKTARGPKIHPDIKTTI